MAFVGPSRSPSLQMWRAFQEPALVGEDVALVAHVAKSEVNLTTNS